MKLKWRVKSTPTGRYRSFEKRGWPDADYPNGRPAVSIDCDTSYSATVVASEKHGPLSVHIACHNKIEDWPKLGAFNWRTLIKRASTLAEAKKLAEDFISSHPEVCPK